MSTYIKKQVTYEAIQFDGVLPAEETKKRIGKLWNKFSWYSDAKGPYLLVEGTRVNPTDFIVTGSDNSVLVVPASNFAAVFEPFVPVSSPVSHN
jgi:hypothetical protein